LDSQGCGLAHWQHSDTFFAASYPKWLYRVNSAAAILGTSSTETYDQMKLSIPKTGLFRLLALLAIAAATSAAYGASGTWTFDGNGNWSDTTKWSGGTVADGAGSAADFSTIDITGDRTVTLDAAHTISTLNFGDAGTPPDHNWILSGPNTLTMGAVPLINVTDETATLGVPLAGTAGLTKVGAGILTFLGTNTYTGTTLLSNGVVNYSGASKSTSGGIFNVGGPAGTAVVNINTTGGLTNNGSSYGVGGQQGDTTDTSVGIINLIAGTLNNGNNNNYTEIGTGSLNGNAHTGTTSYGCINLQTNAAFITLGSSGIRVGAGGIGVFNQTGGTLNSSRYFALGTQPNGGTAANAGGTGLGVFLGGTATVASGYRVIMNDKPGGVGIFDLGTEAGGSATFSELSTASGGAFEFMDQGGASAAAILNLNSGTLRLSAPMYRANTGGAAQFNWNGGTFQAAGNMNFANTNNNFPVVNVFNGGVVIDCQTYNVTNVAQLDQPAGKGIYPAGGTLAISTGGGSGYLGMPLVTVTGGSGANAMAIANLSGGVVTGVTMTAPGQNYLAGDVLSFAFAGGGATTPASTFTYTLQAADVAPNSAGGLTKLGSGKLLLGAVNTYSGPTMVAAGTLDAELDGALGSGNVSVAAGATLLLENGVTNGYIGTGANLVMSSSAAANLNFSGTDTINGLSVNGGATYLAPGTYGSSSSGAANADDTHFTGNGILNVLTTPSVSLTVVLQSSVNPAVAGQSVTLTATATSTGGGTPTGTVTFKDGVTVLGTGTLNGSGVATFTTTTLAVGSHPLTANYNGTVSQILVQTVNIATDVWTGAAGSAWDINSTANWAILGTAAKYQDGNYVQLDDTASGATAITLGVVVSPSSLLFSNSTKNYSVTGLGGIGGATSLIKEGVGALTLDAADTYTGLTAITNGLVTFDVGSSSLGNGSLQVGCDYGSAVMIMNSTNTLTFNGLISVGGIVGDTTGTSAGAIDQNAGTFISLGGGNEYMEIGAGSTSTYGAYDLVNGTLSTANNTGVRVGATGTGIYTQSGGMLNCTRYFAIGTQSGVDNIGGNGVATFLGGSALFSSSYRVIIGDKPGASGVLNLGTEAGGTAVLTNLYNNSGNGGFELLDNAAASSGTLNLNSGILQVGGAIYINSAASGTPAINLNGGTLQAGANNINLITNFSSPLIGNFAANLFGRGLVVDSQTNACSITADLLSTSGDGIYPVGGTLAVTAGGSGYFGAPLVTVSGGSGSGAMAVAAISNGSIVSVTMTSPGQNYQAGDTLDFQFTGGGATTPAGDFYYTLQAGDLSPNANGGLVKIGSGVLNLTSLNDNYTGVTTVSNGLLQISGSLTGGGAVNVLGGTLAGTGTISGPVAVYTGATLAVGVSAVGTLTVNNNVTLLPGAACSVVIDKGSANNDVLQGISQLTYAGTLVVTNLSGTLAVGDSFRIFAAANYAGSFSAINPAIPGAGLAWDTTQLATSGTLGIKVGTIINPNPTNVIASVTGTNLTLGWPADHTGWTLQAQTNSLAAGISANWVDVVGSSTTNQVIFPLNSGNGCVFFRLRYNP
jgi:autotransporter-associated beta strand protein